LTTKQERNEIFTQIYIPLWFNNINNIFLSFSAKLTQRIGNNQYSYGLKNAETNPNFQLRLGNAN